MKLGVSAAMGIMMPTLMVVVFVILGLEVLQ